MKRFTLSLILLFGLSLTCSCDDDAVDNSSSDQKQKELTSAYFIVDQMTIGKRNLEESCDINGNGKPNNAIAAILKAIPKQLVPKSADEKMAESIANGELLVVLGIHNVASFENDNSIKVEAYEGSLAGGEATKELFSGEGTIKIVEPAKSSLDDAAFVDNELVTETGHFSATIPFGDTMIEVELEKASLTAFVEQTPDNNMLNGTATGRLCGAIHADQLAELVQKSDKVKPAIKPLVTPLINTSADLDCNGEKCLSVALMVSVVSVERAN